MNTDNTYEIESIRARVAIGLSDDGQVWRSKGALDRVAENTGIQKERLLEVLNADAKNVTIEELAVIAGALDRKVEIMFW
jgi:hypothetical protein